MVCAYEFQLPGPARDVSGLAHACAPSSLASPSPQIGQIKGRVGFTKRRRCYCVQAEQGFLSRGQIDCVNSFLDLIVEVER